MRNRQNVLASWNLHSREQRKFTIAINRDLYTMNFKNSRRGKHGAVKVLGRTIVRIVFTWRKILLTNCRETSLNESDA